MVEKTDELEPALLTVKQVCKLINVKRATFYKLKASGHFGPLPVPLCRKVLHLRSEIEDWLQAKWPHREQWQAFSLSSYQFDVIVPKSCLSEAQRQATIWGVAVSKWWWLNV